MLAKQPRYRLNPAPDLGDGAVSYRYDNDVLPEEDDLDETFIVRHWRGHLSLSKSWFLVGGLISTILFLLLSAGLVMFCNASDSLQAVAAATLGFFLLFLIVRTWAGIGIWRSAGNHAARGGSPLWANIARGLLVVGALGSAVQARNYWLMTSEYGKLALGHDELGTPAAMTVSADGRTLLIDGTLASGSWQAFRTLIDRNPGVAAVHLNSIGGRIFDADKIARLIREKRIDTQVVDRCISACTIILLAGKERMASRLANIGFHQPDFPGMDGPMRAEMIAGNSEIYREAGIAQPFIDRVMSTPPANVWYPSYDQLMQSGVLTSDAEIVIGGKPADDPVVRAIQREADNSKSQLPLRIDDMTQLVGVTANGRTLGLAYRVSGPNDLRTSPAVRARLTRAVIAQSCSAPQMRRFVDAGATLALTYSDQSGAKLVGIDVDHCG